VWILSREALIHFIDFWDFLDCTDRHLEYFDEAILFNALESEDPASIDFA
jgi:hypothetical protein